MPEKSEIIESCHVDASQMSFFFFFQCVKLVRRKRTKKKDLGKQEEQEKEGGTRDCSALASGSGIPGHCRVGAIDFQLRGCRCTQMQFAGRGELQGRRNSPSFVYLFYWFLLVFASILYRFGVQYGEKTLFPFFCFFPVREVGGLSR